MAAERAAGIVRASVNPRETPRVRCFSCGSRQRASDDACSRCGVPFLVLCGCGHQHSVHAGDCPGCGAPVPAPRFPLSRLPAVRVLKWSLAAVLLAGPVALLALRERKETPWGLKERGLAHFRAQEFPEAARDFEEATRLDPRDKLAWFNLALVWRRLGLSPEVWTDAAERAAEIDPGFADARTFLAAAAAERGDFEEAVDHAAAVAERDPEDALASKMLAELELRRRRPDLRRALAAVRAALRRERASVELLVLQAEILLAIHGLQETSAYPTDVESALREAREALPRLDPKRIAPVQLATLRSRILLATGQPDGAYATAAQAIEELPGGTPAADRLSLQFLKARALHAWKPVGGRARQEFQTVLETRPDRATVEAVTRYLLAAGDAALAETVLAGAQQRGDPDGAISAGLAEVRLATGDAPAAASAVARALAIRPEDPELLLLEGRIHAAAGRLDAARLAFRRAAERSPGSIEPRIQTALLSLAPDVDAASRESALRAAIADVEGLAAESGSPGVRLVLAQLLTAAGRQADAESQLAHATAEAPSLADAWTLLGEIRIRRGAFDAAAEAFSRASSLRPDDPAPVALETRARLSVGDAAGALVAAGRYLSRHRDSQALLELRAEAKLTLGLWDAALEDLRRLLEIDPRSGRWLLQTVETEIRAGRRDEALRRIDAALRAEGEAAGVPADVRSLLVALRPEAAGQSGDDVLTEERARGTSGVLAVLEMRAGRFEAAVETSRKVLAEMPGDPVATEILVLVLSDLRPDDPAAVAEARKAAAALDPRAVPGLGALLRARIALVDGHDEEAFAEASEAVRLLPSHPVAAFVLGEAAYRCGRIDVGLSSLRRSAYLPGAAPGFRRWAARRFTESAARDAPPREARDRLALALQLDPTCLEASLRLARLLAESGDVRGAADLLERAVRQPDVADETAAALRLDAALLNAIAGEDARATALLAAVERTGKAPPRAALVEAWVCLAAQRLDDAEAAFERAAASSGGDPGFALGRAALALARGAPAQGRAAVDAWRRTHPSDDLVPVGFALRLSEQGEHDAAADLLRDVLASRPSSRGASTALARVLVAAGRTDDAVEAARAWVVAAAGGDRVWARCLLVECLSQTAGTAARGIEASRDLAAEAGDVPGLVVRLAAAESHALLLLGRHEEAFRRATEALSGEVPRDVEFTLRHVEGMAAAARGDLARAREALTRALERRPGDPVALNNAAWVLSQSTATASQALELARTATRLRPSQPAFWDTRAVAAAAAGRDDEAATSWTEALRLAGADPSRDPDARARIAIRFARHLAGRDGGVRSREVAASVARFDPPPARNLVEEAHRLAGD